MRQKCPVDWVNLIEIGGFAKGVLPMPVAISKMAARLLYCFQPGVVE